MELVVLARTLMRTLVYVGRSVLTGECKSLLLL